MIEPLKDNRGTHTDLELVLEQRGKLNEIIAYINKTVQTNAESYLETPDVEVLGNQMNRLMETLSKSIEIT